MIRVGVNDGLDAKTLVLNRSYLAIHMVSVRRAFGLLYGERAEVVHVDDGQFANYDFHAWREICELWAEEKQPHHNWIRAVNFEIRVPRVLRLLRYNRAPRRTLRLRRQNLFARDEHRCQYCGRSCATKELSFDHVVPRSRGGRTSWDNVVCCCLKCNVKKGGRTPREARMRLTREPRQPNHSPLLALKLDNPKYEIWKVFLPGASRADDT